MHYRISIFLRPQARQATHASLENGLHLKNYELLQELATVRQDLEWHLQHAEIDSSGKSPELAPSLRAVDYPEAHLHAQPVPHTRWCRRRKFAASWQAGHLL